ncbi:MAG: hypothetical protein JWR51_280 [Devosia sp.]|uniref:bestrophin-like domain n=1 Tax=Devosia sp. TaxID=1871048 RepID=UPI0026303B97|nr:DUF4239 domain-containing protein [Devosia sp.]MDB5527177.1 hypothetical protein [Devosia sp.]
MDLLNDIFIGVLFIGGTIALSLAVYFVARLAVRNRPMDKHPEMASAMVTRIGALHGLILALVFAQEMANYQRLEVQMANEASAVADVFNDAGRYDPVALASVRSNMVDYLGFVVDAEWAALGRGENLDAQAWSAWEAAYSSVLDLTPHTGREASLRDHMLAQLHAIASARDLRELNGTGSLIGLFWFAALSGVVLIAVGYYSYQPQRHNLVLMSLFSAYTGVILFLIYAFSNPYSAPGVLRPDPLIELRGELQSGATP